jgi:transposase InsO family protein
LIDIDYFTKWVEVIPTRTATDTVIIIFLEENILSRFGYPRKNIIDNSQAFKPARLLQFYQDYNIELGHSTTYCPQGNGLVESSNKSLIRIIKKMLSKNKKSCDSHLNYVLWDYRLSTNKALGTSPFQLVYGIDVVFPLHISLPVMKLLQEEV